MKNLGKSIAVGLICLGLAGKSNANPGLESLTNDTHTVETRVEGKINVPYDMARGYLDHIPLVGKLAKALANSPYFIKEEDKKFIFYSDAGVTSRFEVVESTCSSNSFRKGIAIEGYRSTIGEFEAYMLLNFNSNKVGMIDYNSTMYVKLKTGWKNFFIRNLAAVPLVGSQLIKPLFEAEQTGVASMINDTAKKVFENPTNTLDIIGVYTNREIYFTEKDKEYVKKSLEKK